MERWIIALFFFLVLSSASAKISAAGTDEAAVLIAFKSSSITSDPTGFLSNWVAKSSNPCSFSGVICSASAGRVQALNFTAKGLVGDLRLDSLLNLQFLRELHLAFNAFHGNLSYSASLPCSLELVDISSNNFTTMLQPGFLSQCSNLQSLNLSRNSITGGGFPFPDSLKQLDLSQNKIAGAALVNYTLAGCFAHQVLDVLPCSNITLLDLSANHLSGEIPKEFFSTLQSTLQHLNLSHNNLTAAGADFSGFYFGDCRSLALLDLSKNVLNGSGLPSSLGNCQNLVQLDFSGNNFSGKLPTFWGNFSKLNYLSLANNRFSGSIPAELGHVCGTILELDLSGNEFTGGLPNSFTSCSSLQSLNIGDNQLSGDFLDTVVSKMTSLKKLYAPFNNITGAAPLHSLKNCSLLEVIHLGSNLFDGEIPTGFCSSMPSLQKLLLPNNFLSGAVPAELGRCSNLKSIDLSFNNINGAVPVEIWSLPELVDLVMWANNISGNIPDVLCTKGANLETLILSYNRISGSIPDSFTKCVKLIWVSLSGNRLFGKIPQGIGNLQNLAILQLGNNALSGEIPTELGTCKNLIWLDLNYNNFSGSIPPSLASQAGLIVPGIVSGKQFAFLRNEGGNMCPGAGVLFEFEGIRPDRLANFPMVHSCPTTRIYTGTTVYSFASNGSMIYLDLSYNSLSGDIPANFGAMMYLQVLNLGHNELTGPIPDSFVGLKMVMALDLSHNQLTGYIPGSLGTLTFLTDLDFSNNNLTGQIPSTGQLTTFPAPRYENNSGLCGLPLPPCSSSSNHGSAPPAGNRKRSFGGSLLIGVAFFLLVLLSIMVVLYKFKKHKKAEKQLKAASVESASASGTSSWKISGAFEPLSINVAAFETPLKRLTFADLLEATNGFSSESLIGSGGFGEVYKAKLDNGSLVAVKKLIHVSGQGDREFVAEMETIGKIKHRNLVPLLGYCKIGDERLLVYEYMKHGSLDMVLQDKSPSGVKLDWEARKKIAIGSARGLAFLHHSCIPHIIHRDMKSSNVLLDESLNARVSDFGMARLVNASDTHLSVSTLAGTPGYVPPEYYQSFRCTTKGDVYSYGVVLLELLSGKKPIDPLDFGDNNLVGWAKQLVKENKSTEIFDPQLMGKKSAEVELFKYLRIACECLEDRPLRRPTMIQVMAMFKELQTDTDSYSLEGFSIEQSTIDESGEKPYSSSLETSL